MKTVMVLAGACALAVWASGCAPELDQTQLSPEEQAWAKNFKENYSAWQPPESVPRSVRRDDLPQDVPASAVAPEADKTAEVPAAADNSTVDFGAGNALAANPDAALNPPLPEEPAAGAEETYTVSKGDTLSAIAQKFYGRASAWKKIQDANADVLKGKTSIRPGMKLRIPRP